MDRAPKRLWVIVDDEPDQGYGGVMGWETTRKAAHEECSRYNNMRGYEPTCRVVEYRAHVEVCGRRDVESGVSCERPKGHGGNHTGHNDYVGVSWPTRRRA